MRDVVQKYSSYYDEYFFICVYNIFFIKNKVSYILISKINKHGGY